MTTSKESALFYTAAENDSHYSKLALVVDVLRRQNIYKNISIGSLVSKINPFISHDKIGFFVDQNKRPVSFLIWAELNSCFYQQAIKSKTDIACYLNYPQQEAVTSMGYFFVAGNPSHFNFDFSSFLKRTFPHIGKAFHMDEFLSLNCMSNKKLTKIW